MLSSLLLVTLSGAAALAGGTTAARPVTAPVRAGIAQMAAVPVANFAGAAQGEHEVALKVADAGAYVVHRKVVAEQANMRLGTAVAKTRAEVRGGGRKPYQQKGTGRARRGSSRSPLLVGGGKTFGPRQKSYKIKINKKEGRLAISTALMGALPRMTIVNDFEGEFTAPKTANMQSFLERLGADTSGTQNCLVITKERHENTCALLPPPHPKSTPSTLVPRAQSRPPACILFPRGAALLGSRDSLAFPIALRWQLPFRTEHSISQPSHAR